MKRLSVCLIFVVVFGLLSCKEEAKVPELEEYQQYHTITLSFDGPETSEKADENPFLNYRLEVIFKSEESEYTVRGFYAADGNAAESSAEAGNIWQVRFNPDKVGKWSYVAQLHHGESVALSNDIAVGKSIELANASGEFMVIPSDKTGKDFRAKGRLTIDNGYFKFKDSDEYWIKGGANSPENLLAYDGFDATFRTAGQDEDGEMKINDTIHRYAPHIKDWQEGDPTWQEGKGKGLIGALNYLASKDMNVVYFLTNNIKGDGKDVWPYIGPDDFTRFDVSRLAQWEIVFQHMQSKGLMLHMVLQETENETMLDGGDTGPMRQLYLREIMARFGHHLALKFNLGEENGPADFSPIAQNDAQRKVMTTFLKKIDPYDHPILLHTHSADPERSHILDSIVGFEPLDGLSLQVNKREGVADVISEWREKSIQAGRKWLMTMDEIGMWHTGARSDSLDSNHDSLRRYVLWGTLLSGGAGVEWYFGANNRYHDLNTEDWRSRDRLWEITAYALDFFEKNLPYWEMQPEHTLINSKDAYCFVKSNEIYAVYLPDSKNYKIDLRETNGEFTVQWFDPLAGGQLLEGYVNDIVGGSMQELGLPPKQKTTSDNQDWVILIKKKI